MTKLKIIMVSRAVSFQNEYRRSIFQRLSPVIAHFLAVPNVMKHDKCGSCVVKTPSLKDAHQPLRKKSAFRRDAALCGSDEIHPSQRILTGRVSRYFFCRDFEIIQYFFNVWWRAIVQDVIGINIAGLFDSIL
jgi:hypothetical protein